jgi:hypothetical protein
MLIFNYAGNIAGFASAIPKNCKNPLIYELNVKNIDRFLFKFKSAFQLSFSKYTKIFQ